MRETLTSPTATQTPPLNRIVTTNPPATVEAGCNGSNEHSQTESAGTFVRIDIFTKERTANIARFKPSTENSRTDASTRLHFHLIVELTDETLAWLQAMREWEGFSHQCVSLRHNPVRKLGERQYSLTELARVAG